MTTDELTNLFEKYEDDFLRHERIEQMRHCRPDMHAMLLLDELYPSQGDMIDHAEHDEIWFAVIPEDVAEKITEAQVLQLVRCGIRCDGESFQSFV